MPPPDDLVDQLRAGAAPVDAGRFRIDSNRALEKLRQFRLADPHHYVLELLRAAVVSRARWATVRTDSDDFELSFDGDPFPPAHLKELLAQALMGGADRDARRARLLSLGVAGALALQPRWVRVQSGEWQVELDGGARATVSRAPPLPSPQRTRIHVRGRLSWRVARDALFGSREGKAIAELCRELPIPLTMNDRALGPARSFDEPVLAKVQREEDGMRLWAAFPRRRLGQSLVRFHLHGVQICERRWDGLRTPILASVHDEELQRNASGSDVVLTDPRYRKALQALEAMVEPLLAAVAQRLRAAPDPQAREVLLEASAGATGKIRGIVDSALLLPGPSGEWFSVNELRAEHAAGRPLRYATRAYPAGAYARPVLLLETDRRVLELLPGKPRVDVAEEVAAREAALEQRSRWENQESEELTLPPTRYLVRAVVKGRGFSGEAGVLERSGPRATVRVLLERKLLFVESPDDLPPGTVAVVNIATPSPTLSAWAKPHAGIRLDRFLGAIRSALVAGAVESVEEHEGPLREGVRALARWLVAHAVNAAESEDALRLPAALRGAPIYELAGEAERRASLEDLLGWPLIRQVEQPWPHPLLSGEPAVTLSRWTEAGPLARLLGDDRVQDVTQLLREEARIRQRIASGPEPLDHHRPTLVSLEIDGADCRGKMGLLEEGSSGLELRLFVSGILVEEVSLTAHYGHAAAAVASESLTPREGWSGVLRDAAFDRVVEVVRGGERALMGQLLEKLGGKELSRWPLAARRYFRGFVHRELTGLRGRKDLDPLAVAVAGAAVISTSQGPRSLRALAEWGQRNGRLWIQETPVGDEVYPDMLIVYADPTLGALLKQVARVEGADPVPELRRRRDREAFQHRATADPKVDASLQLIVPVEAAGGLRGEVGAPARHLGTQLELSLDGRHLESRFVETVLGMDAALDLPEGSMDPVEPVPPLLERAVQDALEEAELKLLLLGAERWDWPETRALVYRALGQNLDARLPVDARQALLERPLVPCDSGQWFPVRHFDEIRQVPYVTRDPGRTPNRGPVVVVDSEAVAAMLPRWTSTNVTQQVAAELEARRRREALPQLQAFAYAGLALERVPLSGSAAQGEIALVATRTGTIELFHHGRALCQLHEEALPECAAVAVNDDRLTPTADETDVVRDRAYYALVRELVEHLDLRAAGLASRWESTPADGQALLRPLALQLAVWQARRKVARAPLLEVPLLEASDGAPMPVASLLEAKAERREVRWSSVPGALLEPGPPVWRPRPGERPLLSALSLPLEDVSAKVRAAQERRERARRERFEVGLQSPFREPLPAPRRGEVALRPDEPSGQLQLTLFKDGVLLESITSPHEVGAMAKVDDPALSPAKDWQKAGRNAAFKAMRQAVDLAVERAVVKRLDSRETPGWLAYARAALAWRSGSAGPLAEALPGLELFTGAAGQPVRLGEVLAEVSRRGAVAVVDPALGAAAPPDRLVLRADAANLGLLADLQFRTDDLSADLQAARDVEATRAQRRLQSLAFPGVALVRLSVDRPGGFRGELALPADAAEGHGVTLAREGIAVTQAVMGGLALAGTLEHPELPVDPTWRSAELTVEQRRDLKEEADALFLKLAGVSPAFEPAQRQASVLHVLRYLQHAGMKDASQLDRLPETAQRVADAPVFRAAEGRWVGLRTAAAQALRRNGLAVLGAKVPPGSELALQAEDLASEWVMLLGEVLGVKRVEVIHDQDAWRDAQARAEPEDDSPLARGLDRLRCEAALLRADALGRLTTKELDRIRLHRRGGKGAPIRYGEQRREAMLDPDHPLIRAALEAAADRPEGIYVLLASIYGAVNRALERVTDEDEARMLDALARHLAANPELLEPSPRT
ncbi:MAG TPA: hypothetical protein VIG99_23970 [Myxococcaceae bacterium]